MFFDAFSNDPLFADISDEMEENEIDWFSTAPKVKSTIHGYAFENMFKSDD